MLTDKWVRYKYTYHSWKKIGILATGCRRWGVKNDAKGQKSDVKLQKNSPKSKEKFAETACVIFWLPSILNFFKVYIYIYILIVILFEIVVINYFCIFVIINVFIFVVIIVVKVVVFVVDFLLYFCLFCCLSLFEEAGSTQNIERMRQQDTWPNTRYHISRQPDNRTLDQATRYSRQLDNNNTTKYLDHKVWHF